MFVKSRASSTTASIDGEERRGRSTHVLGRTVGITGVAAEDFTMAGAFARRFAGLRLHSAPPPITHRALTPSSAGSMTPDRVQAQQRASRDDAERLRNVLALPGNRVAALISIAEDLDTARQVFDFAIEKITDQHQKIRLHLDFATALRDHPQWDPAGSEAVRLTNAALKMAETPDCCAVLNLHLSSQTPPGVPPQLKAALQADDPDLQSEAMIGLGRWNWANQTGRHTPYFQAAALTARAPGLRHRSAQWTSLFPSPPHLDPVPAPRHSLRRFNTR